MRKGIRAGSEMPDTVDNWLPGLRDMEKLGTLLLGAGWGWTIAGCGGRVGAGCCVLVGLGTGLVV